MYFWLKYSDKCNHLERIPMAVKNIDPLFCMVREILESDKLYLFLHSDSTRINDNEYLGRLVTTTELIACTDKQMQNCQSILR